MAKEKFIIACTGCPTGVAHTFMAKEALEKQAKAMGIRIKVETHGQAGIKNKLTKEDIENAIGVIIAADKNVDSKRFVGKQVAETRVQDGIHKPEQLINKILDGDAPMMKGELKKTSSVKSDVKVLKISKINEWTKEDWKSQLRRILGSVYKDLMNGVSHMLPFVVGGGVLIALSFLFDMENAGDSIFGQGNEFSKMLNIIGGTGFGLMVPIMAGFIAHSIADRPGFVPGFIGGMLCNGVDGNAGSGFLGGILAGFIAGYFMKLLIRSFRNFPESLEGLKAIFIYPVVGMFVVGAIVYWLNVPMEKANTGMMNWLELQSNKSSIVLGLIIGVMCAADMGGPINKAAYLTGVALLGQGNYTFMAGVSAACITPPLVIAVATLIHGKGFSKEDRNAGALNWVLGSTHITEGAIPFAAKNPIVVIPILMVGSSISAILTYTFGIEVPAPHGGFLVLPLVSKWYLWLLSIAIGSITGGLMFAGYTYWNNKKHPEKAPDDYEAMAVNTVKNIWKKITKQNSGIVDEELIIEKSAAKNQKELFNEIAEVALKQNKIKNKKSLIDALNKREQEGPTGMGDGIAIPHAQLDDCEKTFIVIFSTKNKLKWNSMDGKDVQWGFAIVVPKKTSSIHLEILAKLSTQLLNEEFVKLVKNYKTNEVYKSLRTLE